MNERKKERQCVKELQDEADDKAYWGGMQAECVEISF